MFKPEDFTLSLEKQLKFRLIEDDIDKCEDIKVLKESLKLVSHQLMRYQQLLDASLRVQMESEIEKMLNCEKDKM